VHVPRQRRFKSARLIGEYVKNQNEVFKTYESSYEKPWVDTWKMGKTGKKKNIAGRTWDSIIFWTCIFLGFALGGLMCYFGYTSVVNYDVCFNHMDAG
jgi:hypothetical protein